MAKHVSATIVTCAGFGLS